MVVLLGEAGAGKSALLRDAEALALRIGLTVRRGQCRQGAGPYRPLVEALLAVGRCDLSSPRLRPYRTALATILPGEGPVGSPPPDPVLAIGEGLLAAIHEIDGDAGTLLLLEDLHDSDTDTLAVLEYMSGRSPQSGIMILATARIEEMSPRLSALVNEPSIMRLPVMPLTPEAVLELADVVLRGGDLPAAVGALLVEKSAGLPLLVEELLAGMIDAGTLRLVDQRWELVGPLDAAVPASLTMLVHRRMQNLDSASTDIVQAAAVVGDVIDWRLLAAVTGRSDNDVADALSQARAAALIGRNGTTLRWRHALLREAVLSDLLPPHRSAFAAHAAAELERRANQSTMSRAADLAAAAQLRVQADQPEKALVTYETLATEALRAGLPTAASSWFDRAAQLGGPRRSLVVKQVRALTVTGHAMQALDLGRTALARTSGPDHAALCLEMARAAVTAARWGLAMEYLNRSGRAGDNASADALIADAAFGAGDITVATALSERVIANTDVDSETLCRAIDVHARCLARADPEAGETEFRRLALVAAEAGLTEWRIKALVGAGTMELAQLDLSPSLNEARELAVDAGMLVLTTSIDLLLADSRFLVAGPSAARPLGQRSVDLATRIGLHPLAAAGLTLIASDDAAKGDAASMEMHLSRAIQLATGDAQVTAMTYFARAFAPLTDGDLATARDALDRAVAAAESIGGGAPLEHWGLWVVLRAVLDDDAADAARRLRDAPAAIRVVNRAALLFADAVRAGRCGDSDSAARDFDTATSMLTTQHWWRRLLRVIVLHSAVVDSWGDPVPALRAELAQFEISGESRLQRVARDLLRRSGSPVRRGRGDSTVPPELRAFAVTSREGDVLSLVTSGLTNAEVAARLFLSVRTVDHHVASLLVKTGAANRLELTRRFKR